MRILARVRDEHLWRRVGEAAARVDAELVDARAMDTESIGTTLADENDLVLVETAGAVGVDRLRADVDRADAALVLACPTGAACPVGALARADEWVPVDVEAAELALRIRTAADRARAKASWKRRMDAADLFRYEELLFDNRTRFPTVPLMIEDARELLRRHGELTIVYLHFVRYSKLEEIFGWQKLDAVLQTTADAVREYYAQAHAGGETIITMTFSGDDDFVVFNETAAPPDQAERQLRALTTDLDAFVARRLEQEHGDEIASLCAVYVGRSTIVRNPKLRTERQIYRGIRQAAQAARSAEQWERTERIDDLKATLRDGAVFMEYHPIVVTATEEVYGYEALARGARRQLRSPEVLFEVADEANLVWELSRLLRQRAVEGIINRLADGQLLFLNVDPQDFEDPMFRDLDADALGVDDPGRIVFEITERIAIRDYPRFQTLLAAFRERGFRFAVDDAGSGYAGLGSIANLAPDFIKLDFSLISSIDTNFLKQNLVETLVSFAEEHGAQVIAEGVETRVEFETIRRIGVHLAQGFYFHRPQYAPLRRSA